MSGQPIRIHGQQTHMPNAQDPIPWLGDQTEGQLGVHMIGLSADRPAPAANNAGLLYFATDGGGSSGGGLSAVVATYAATVVIDSSTPAGPDFGGNLVYGTELFSYGAGNDAPTPLVTGLYLFACEIIYTGAGDTGKFVQTELSWHDPIVLSDLTSNMLWPLLPSGGPPGIGQITSGPSAAFWLTAGETGGLNFETTSSSSQTLGMNITVTLITGAGGGGGIQFGGSDVPTYGPENSGDWLSIKTTENRDGGSDPEGSGGIYMETLGGIWINARDTADSEDGDGLVAIDAGRQGLAVTVDTTVTGETSENQGMLFLVNSPSDGSNEGIFLWVKGGGDLDDDEIGISNGGVAIKIEDDYNQGYSMILSGDFNEGSVMRVSGTENQGMLFQVEGTPSTTDATQNGISLQVSGTGNFISLVGLPTSNPGGSNNVWNNGGVLNIT